MFQREIQFIIDFSINKIKNLDNRLSLADLVRADIHPAIIKYISGQLGIMINSDRQKLLKDSIFDYSGKSVQKYFNLIEEELKRTSKLDSSLITKAINISVSFHINHLVRPKFTLIKFLYNKEEVKNVNEIKLLLNNFYYYDYSISLIKGYIDKKKIETLSRQEFEELYDKIDKALIETYPKSLFESHINGICDFINIGDVNKSKMQLHSFELFLGEKELTEYILILKENYGDDLKLKIDKNELLNFIKNNPIEIVRQNFKYKVDKNTSENIIPENLQIKKEEEIELTENSEPIEEIEINVKTEIELEPSIEKNEEKVEEDVENNLEIDLKEETKEELVEDVEDVLNIVNSEEKIEEEDSEVIINDFVEINTKVDEEFIIEKNEDYTSAESEGNPNIEDSVEEVSAESEEISADPINLSEVSDEQNIIEEITLEESEEYTFETVDSEADYKTIELQSENLVKYESEQSSKEYIEELLEEEELKIEFVEQSYKSEEIEEVTKEIDIKLNEDVIKNIENKLDNEETKEKLEPEYKESAIDVYKLMDEKDINKIIKNLFNDDYEDFAEHVEKMGQMDSIDETITYINTYCNNMGISENKKEVVLFKKLITHHFSR